MIGRDDDDEIGWYDDDKWKDGDDPRAAIFSEFDGLDTMMMVGRDDRTMMKKLDGRDDDNKR